MSIVMSEHPQEIRYSKKVGDYFRRMFNRFNEENIRYCVLHSYQDLPDLTTSDVDMAIDSQGLRAAELILFEIAESLGYKVIQKLYYDVPKSYYYVLFFRESHGAPGFIQLDFMHDSLGIGRYLLKTEAILSGRKRYKDFYVPSVPVEACYLLIKKTMKQTLQSEHRERLRHLLEEDQHRTSRLITSVFGKGSLPRIKALIREERPEVQTNILGILRRSALIRHRVLKPHLSVLKALWLAKRMLERVTHPTGMMVTLLSPDGGGKSAVADQLLTRLRPGFRRVRKIHWRPNLLPPLRKILNPTKWRETEPPNHRPHARQPTARFISVVRFMYYLADYALGFFARIFWPKIRTALVVTERYYYDFLTDTARFGLDLPYRLPERLLPLIPRPNLIVVLNGPSETIYSRKQEVSLKEIDRQLKSINSLARFLPNAHKVNVDQPFDAELIEVEDLIINMLEIRLRKRLGR